MAQDGSDSDDNEGREEQKGSGRLRLSGYPLQAVVDSGASTFIMKHPADHYSEYESRKGHIEIAKQGAHLHSTGEGTLPIMVQGMGNVRVDLNLENTLHAPSIRRDLFSISAACDMGLSAIFTMD